MFRLNLIMSMEVLQISDQQLQFTHKLESDAPSFPSLARKDNSKILGLPPSSCHHSGGRGKAGLQARSYALQAPASVCHMQLCALALQDPATVRLCSHILQPGREEAKTGTALGEILLPAAGSSTLQ